MEIWEYEDEDKEDLFILESTDMNHELSQGWLDVIKKMCNLKSIEYVTERPKNAYSFMAGTRECFIILDEKIDYTKEIEKLNGEIKYQQGFLDSVMKKLNNQKFIEKAPQNVIETEKNKRDESESKIRSLNEQIKQYERDSRSMETT